MADAASGQLDTVMQEKRLFPPPAEFAANARIGSLEAYQALYDEAAADIEAFWAKQAQELHWFKPYDQVLEWNEPFAKWFVGGKTNMAYNCLDRHAASGRKDKPAIVWEGEPGDQRILRWAVEDDAGDLEVVAVQRGDIDAGRVQPGVQR